MKWQDALNWSNTARLSLMMAGSAQRPSNSFLPIWGS